MPTVGVLRRQILMAPVDGGFVIAEILQARFIRIGEVRMYLNYLL